MPTSLRTAVAAAAIAGAGLAGFGITSAFAQTDTGDDATTTTEAPADASTRPGAPGCEGRGGGPALDAMAEAIGIEVEDLRAALEDGQTPAEVAEANDVSRADLVDAIVAEITDRIEQGAENGDLSQAQADERLADVEDHANDIVDGMGHGPGGPPPPSES
ncbi:MAG: hypothetical protein ABW279_06335 [Acidimicrobiales bacterium]